eukprot:TRINITY_DN16473_c0_g1_i3.p3 TRINITY_DN16473_c0_g1~~TRINITY_DN16473_c0_g1_i3.p3  ORF type:complete len:120 (-),score=6.75 TRINITY_DN16473_c0_g1_i3:42-401(-)
MAYARATYGEDLCMKEPERTNEVTGQYVAACKEVAAACGGIPVVDLWTVLQSKPNWQAMLTDGLHLAPAGNAVLHGELTALLQGSGEWSPPLVQERMPWDFPEHINIDGENPERALQGL